MNNVPVDCPFAPRNKRAPLMAHYRVLHASPDAPEVDVYVNNVLVFRRLSYREFTRYISVSPGAYVITVFPTGTRVNPVITQTISVAAGSIYTLAAVNRLQNIALQVIPDPRISILPYRTYVRVVHLSPNAPTVDITLPDGRVLFDDVSYRQVTPYIQVAPQNYTLQARVAATGEIVLNVPNVNLRPGNIYTVYVIGLAGEQPGLQVLIPLDGSTYLQ